MSTSTLPVAMSEKQVEQRRAELRNALLAEITPADLAAITRTLINLAKESNLQAAKLVLVYSLGKPESPTKPQAEPMRIARARPVAPLPDLLPEFQKAAQGPPSTNGILDDLRDRRAIEPVAQKT